LESGEKEELEIWKRMVDRSIKDFDRFYDSLNIHLDYVIGESFYANI
jgi:arginyl-tRNA synthetase